MINYKRHIYGLPCFKPYRLFRTWQISRKYKKVVEGFLYSSFPSMLCDDWEYEIRQAMNTLINKADVVIDVGANTGFYAILAAHRGKKTIAVEPDRGNLIILNQNIRQNTVTHLVEVFEGILSEKPGLSILYGDGDMASTNANWQGVSKYFRTRVIATTLDQLIGEKWKNKNLLVKIDVEGAELQVLLGAKSILNRTPKPVFVLETMPLTPTGKINPAYDQVFVIMKNHGYTWVELSNHNFLFTLNEAPSPAQSAKLY